MRGERATICKKEKKAKNCEKKKEAAAASASTAPSSSKSTQINCISVRNGPPNLLSKGEKTEEEEVVDMGGGGSETEESERSSVDIDNTLDPDGAPTRSILFLGYAKASCSYKGCKGRKVRCTPEVVGYPVPVGKYVSTFKKYSIKKRTKLSMYRGNRSVLLKGIKVPRTIISVSPNPP